MAHHLFCRFHHPARPAHRLMARYWLRAIAVTMLIATVTLTSCQPLQAPAAPPELDRVGFPTDYAEKYTLFYELDRLDNKTARAIYANAAAATVAPGQPYPYGSVLVMEVHRTLKDEAGNVLLDADGRYQREQLSGLFVMRKELSFGAKYGEFRNGEWEYVAYRGDGTLLTPPERTNGCASCHMEAGQGKDWVFGTHRHFGVTAAAPAENTVNVVDYAFQPATITVTAGTTVTWTSNDVVMHTVTAKDFTFGSGALRPKASFRHFFAEAGLYDYVCAIHPSMRGQVVVRPQ